MKRFLTSLLLVFYAALTPTSAALLFHNGRSDYHIVLPTDASTSEKTAARELQGYLKQISGATLPITTSPPATHALYVGFSPRVARLTGATKPDSADEGFTYRTVGDDLVIYGGRRKGTMFGVYAFLRQQLGVRFYTSSYTKLPRRTSWQLPRLNVAEAPAFPFRHVLYYTTLHDHAWDAHNGLNMTMGNADTDAYGGLQAIYGTHTFGELVPPDEFFSQHPEYFSLRDGKRQHQLTQLCLSNPDVVRLLTQRTLQMIRQHPGNVAYSVAQNDNSNPCQCTSCLALEKKYGGHSGLILWAVNQVADEVAKHFPDARLVTFAYHYSQAAPTGIRPRSNVYIHLCDIECCLAHPMTDAENSAFMNDLQAWSALTSHLFIWDYVTDFAAYLAPFPNFQAMAANLRTLHQHGVTGVMNQGQYQTYGGEFYELRQWLLAQLLWNPDQDWQALAQEFIADYYGASATYVLAYFNLVQSLVKPTTHLHTDTKPTDDLYTEAFLARSRTLLKKAARAARSDTALAARLEEVQAQISYLDVARNRTRALTNGSHAALVKFLKTRNQRVGENVTAKEFLRKEGAT